MPFVFRADTVADGAPLALSLAPNPEPNANPNPHPDPNPTPTPSPNPNPNPTEAWRKGLTGYPMVDVLGPDRPLAYLSGPSFAMEIAQGLATAVTVASTDRDLGYDTMSMLTLTLTLTLPLPLPLTLTLTLPLPARL